MVRREGESRDRDYAKPLFQIAVLQRSRLARRLRAKDRRCGRIYSIRAHKLENSVGFAGAVSLLALLKTGGRGSWRRALEKREPEAPPQTRSVTERKSSTGAAEPCRRNRYWLWLNIAMTVLWVALLLSIVAYAVVEGEMAMAQLDDLALVATYSLSP